MQDGSSRQGLAFLDQVFWHNVQTAQHRVAQYDFVRAIAGQQNREEHVAQQIYQEIAADLDQFTQNFEQLQRELCPDSRPQYQRRASLIMNRTTGPSRVARLEEHKRGEQEVDKRGDSDSESERTNVKRRLSFSRAFGGPN